MMKQKTVLALGLIAVTSLAGALAQPVQASGDNGWGHGSKAGHKMHTGQSGMGQSGMDLGMHGGQDGKGMMNQQMTQMMMRMHGQMMKDGGMMSGGMGQGMMGNPLYKSFDKDGDGRVSPEEMRAGQQAKLEQYDANGDGSLSLDEFEALHSAAIRERMVDRFQGLDNDGDGQVNSEEMTAPARKLERMQKKQAQSDQAGKYRPGAMTGSGTENSEDNN